MESGFVPLRRGLLDHMIQGKMSPLELGIYVAILLKADHRTGVWWGSAASLGFIYPGIDRRYAQKCLFRLEENGYIKRFRSEGKRGNYPMLVNRFVATDGRRTNAEETIDWRDVKLTTGAERETERETEQVTERVTERTPIQEVIIENKENTTAAGASFAAKGITISSEQDAKFSAAFPGVDLMVEYRKMEAWISANPSRAPKKNFGAFAYKWLNGIRRPPPPIKHDHEFPLAESETQKILM